MQYVYLVIALLSGTAKGYCAKKTGKYTETLSKIMIMYFLRMLICILIGSGFVLADGGFGRFAVSGVVLGVSALNGIFSAIMITVFALIIRDNAYMLGDISLALGVAVPITLSAWFFGDSVRPVQWLGLLLLIAATAVICTYNNTVKKQKLSPVSFLLLFICGLSSGLSDFCQRWFRQLNSGAGAAAFNFYSFAFGAAFLAVAALLTLSTDKRKGKTKPDYSFLKKIRLYVIVMSVALFLHSYCKTAATALLPPVVVYPIMQGGGLALTAAMTSVFFKEKITVRLLFGMGVAFAALLIINLL